MDLANRLISKLAVGAATPGPNMIPYALMPEMIRKKIPMEQPPIGWDPEALAPDERALLNHLLYLGQKERPETVSTPEDLARAQRQMDAAEREDRLNRLREIQMMGQRQK